MSRILKLGLVQAMVVFSISVFADVINLNDGTILEGDVIGIDNGIVMVRIDGKIRAIPENEIRALVTEEGSAAPVLVDPTPLVISVRAGTRLVLSMLDDVDTSRHSVGHRFRAQLESALVVNGITVAPRGTILYGTITESDQARRATGRSELSMDFRDILIGDQLLPIATGDLSIRGKSEGRRSLRRIARAAAIGGLIDGSDGAKTGARVGVGVALLTKGESIKVTRGTILETTLRVPLNLRQ